MFSTLYRMKSIILANPEMSLANTFHLNNHNFYSSHQWFPPNLLVCPFVWKNVNIGHNLWMVSDRTYIVYSSRQYVSFGTMVKVICQGQIS